LLFDARVDLAEFTDNTNRAADAALAAFHELGEHLAVMEGEHALPAGGLNEAKRSLERDVIKRALDNAKGRVVHAARNLGISFQALTKCWKRDTKIY